MNISDSKIFYIALGSNKGNRIAYLNDSINMIIDNSIGNILSISKIYKSEALGFDSDYFYNACIALESNLKENDVLKRLLNIENILGRIRSNNKQYESRVIDLDIALIDDLIIDNSILQVPHPRMHKRQFVLKPLNDIAPHIIHPILNKTINHLLKACPDKSCLEVLDMDLKLNN